MAQKFQEGKKKHCIVFVKADVSRQAGDQALPGDVGTLDPTPASPISWSKSANVGVCRQCPARKYDFSISISAKDYHLNTSLRYLLFSSVVQSPFGH